jgi:hypothetical protein
MPIEIPVTNINLIISIISMTIALVGYLKDDIRNMTYFGILSIFNLLLSMAKPIW